MVGNGSTMFVEAILLSGGSRGSVGWLDPLRLLSVDSPSFVVCVNVLGMPVKVLLPDLTISIVCEALSAAVKNELAISSPELVGSSILTLPDPESNEEAVDCTPGTMIEILADRVEAMIGSPVEAVFGLDPDVVLVEPMLLENEKLRNGVDIEPDDARRERFAASAVTAVLAIEVDSVGVEAMLVPSDTNNPGREGALEGKKRLITESDRDVGEVPMAYPSETSVLIAVLAADRSSLLGLG